MFFEDKNNDGLILEDPTNPQGNEVLQRELYYPFGLQFRGTAPLTPGVKQPYLYNGKELDDTGLYAYGFRFYDPATARFTGVDPLADSYAGWSPYNFVMGSPVSLVDPDGRSAAYPLHDYFDNKGNYLGSDNRRDEIRIVDESTASSVSSLSSKERLESYYKNSTPPSNTRFNNQTKYRYRLNRDFTTLKLLDSFQRDIFNFSPLVPEATIHELGHFNRLGFNGNYFISPSTEGSPSGIINHPEVYLEGVQRWTFGKSNSLHQSQTRRAINSYINQLDNEKARSTWSPIFNGYFNN